MGLVDELSKARIGASTVGNRVMPTELRVRGTWSNLGEAAGIEIEFLPLDADQLVITLLVTAFLDDAVHVVSENLGQWFDVPLDGFPEIMGVE